MTPNPPAIAAMIVGSIDLLFLSARKHSLQIRVIYFRLRTTDEAHFFWFSGRGDADALNSLRRLLFAVVIISDLVFVAVNIEADLRQINLRAKVMGVLKLCLSSGLLLRELKFSDDSHAGANSRVRSRVCSIGENLIRQNSSNDHLIRKLNVDFIFAILTGDCKHLVQVNPGNAEDMELLAVRQT